jgi:hypothetical protein
MKLVLMICLVSFLTIGTASATSHTETTQLKAPEVKQVCKEFKGKKQCKKLKIHKKFTATKVPTPVKAPAKPKAKAIVKPAKKKK